jgi:hypothetical protein
MWGNTTISRKGSTGANWPLLSPGLFSFSWSDICLVLLTAPPFVDRVLFGDRP